MKREKKLCHSFKKNTFIENNYYERDKNKGELKFKANQIFKVNEKKSGKTLISKKSTRVRPTLQDIINQEMSKLKEFTDKSTDEIIITNELIYNKYNTMLYLGLFEFNNEIYKVYTKFKK